MKRSKSNIDQRNNVHVTPRFTKWIYNFWKRIVQNRRVSKSISQTYKSKETYSWNHFHPQGGCHRSIGGSGGRDPTWRARRQRVIILYKTTLSFSPHFPWLFGLSTMSIFRKLDRPSCPTITASTKSRTNVMALAFTRILPKMYLAIKTTCGTGAAIELQL